jgi:hypothetical protein
MINHQLFFPHYARGSGGLKPEKQKPTHVGGYPRCGITARVQTQRFPIAPGTSAELHIVDVLDLPHLFTLGPTRRAGSAALPKFDAPERRYAQRGVDQQGRLLFICKLPPRTPVFYFF